MGDAGETGAPPLPQPQLSVIEDGIWQLLPLSRKGSGPGLILLTPENFSQEETLTIKNGNPSPLVKWAEESYAVVQIQSSAFSTEAVHKAIAALSNCPNVEDAGRCGLIVYDVATFQQHEPQISSISSIAGAVVYADASKGPIQTRIPSVQHLAGKPTDTLPRSQHLTAHAYPTAVSDTFALPSSKNFDYALEAVSHTRSLTFLKHHTILAGPIFDLEALWDEHTLYEFGERHVTKTMATMVQEPYVNHIPTLTGGIGRVNLTDFYTHHFIFSNPDDAELELISRTIGIDRVVDEFLYKCTHDRKIDWLAPGVPPTGKYCQIPMMAVVNIRGDRLYHEHIHWDGATVLRQLGLLPTQLPWPSEYKIPGPEFFVKGKENGKGQVNIVLPAAGLEAAEKLKDKNAIESNAMFEYGLVYSETS